MEFFCHHRDRSGSATRRGALLEEHRSYMDQYARELIARGPTLTNDGQTATGSVHILDLPEPAHARQFAFNEPYYRWSEQRSCVLWMV